jgi:glycogen debranching enzyme
MAAKGNAIWKEKVWRLFPKEGGKGRREENVADVVLEILEEHANGIHFREWNAGKEIDDRMKDNGFNVDIVRDPKTGFLCGGNTDTCGTWMDKMGESAKAGNRGVPASPRDGAPVELTALLFRVLFYLAKFHNEGTFPFDGVQLKKEGKLLKFGEWAKQIKDNFFHEYYVPLHEKDDGDYSVNKTLANRRGIFKDTVFCAEEWASYQLRPNMCVAIGFAPELFVDNKSEANNALDTAEKYLLAPLGMRTLDPSDWNYNPNYLSNETDDYKSSCGFNYHNGPEWLWVFGCFLTALVEFREGAKDIISKYTVLHAKYLSTSPWLSLPELTNENGNKCWSSCEAQAWSVACILEALHNAEQKDK